MDIQSRKIEFVQSFLGLQSEKMVAEFEKLLKKSKKIEAQDVKPLSVEELNKRISTSEKDFENKRFKTSAQLLAKY